MRLQGDIHAKDQQIEKCGNIINHLRERYVDETRNLGQDHSIIIAQKHATSATNKHHDVPSYASKT